MNRRLASIIVPLALAIPVCAFAQSPASTAPAVVQSAQGDANEAKTLKTAEMKLAALAKEGNSESGPLAAAKQKVTDKKPHPVQKKRLSKSRHRAQAKWEMTGNVKKIVGRRLTQAEVQGILATTRDFSGSDLSGLNLVGVDLSGVKFNRANLQMANLERADLAESDLELANLSNANLRGASLNQARLRGTRMEGTRMDGALWVDRTVCKKGSVGSCIE
jgi:hypothetical protein